MREEPGRKVHREAQDGGQEALPEYEEGDGMVPEASAPTDAGSTPTVVCEAQGSLHLLWADWQYAQPEKAGMARDTDLA
jgi:hypothetical protein